MLLDIRFALGPLLDSYTWLLGFACLGRNRIDGLGMDDDPAQGRKFPAQSVFHLFGSAVHLGNRTGPVQEQMEGKVDLAI